MRLRAFLLAGAAFAGAPAIAQDLTQAPPAFGYRDGTVVPIDIESVHIDYVFDVAAKTTSAHAVVTFDVDAGGMPMLDLVPNPRIVKLDGETVDPADFPTIDDPDRVTRFRVLRRQVEAGSRHILEIDYSLDSSDVTFGSRYVRVGFFMSDLTTGGRAFFEQYGPANYEFDQIAYTFDVKVVGTTTEHQVFTNGRAVQEDANHWSIEFPTYFTTSSVYFHLSEKGRFVVNEFEIQGLEKTIPVTVYASSSSLVNDATSRARRYLAELEETYGPYLHDKIVVYVTSSGGGMEYGGATMTTLGAQGHEMTHFWFARGVMPNNANSGWIDEAIASWRDNGYPRARSGPNRSPVNLGGFSPYRRHTTRDAYSRGQQLISELDYLTRENGGMRPVLREMFANYKAETITVNMFQTFLEGVTGLDLEAIFRRYVFGRSSLGFKVIAPENPLPDLSTIKHPRPYTKEELLLYR